jgi:hypothetical protein
MRQPSGSSVSSHITTLDTDIPTLERTFSIGIERHADVMRGDHPGDLTKILIHPQTGSLSCAGHGGAGCSFHKRRLPTTTLLSSGDFGSSALFQVDGPIEGMSPHSGTMSLRRRAKSASTVRLTVCAGALPFLFFGSASSGRSGPMPISAPTSTSLLNNRDCDLVRSAGC